MLIKNFIIIVVCLILISCDSLNSNDSHDIAKTGFFLSKGKVYKYDFIRQDTNKLTFINDSILGFSNLTFGLMQM